jgi:hypothetical protein
MLRRCPDSLGALEDDAVDVSLCINADCTQ